MPRETVSFVSPRSRGKKTHCIPRDQSLSVLLYRPTQNEKKVQINCVLYPSWLTNLRQSQGACPDHVQVESSCCRFPRELVSFVRPRELVSFDPQHVTHSPPIGKRIWVGSYNNCCCPPRCIQCLMLQLEAVVISFHCDLGFPLSHSVWRTRRTA